MKTMCDKPQWTCFTCTYSSPETFMMNDMECVECRRNHPAGGFPVMFIESYCFDGKLSRAYIKRLEDDKERS